MYVACASLGCEHIEPLRTRGGSMLKVVLHGRRTGIFRRMNLPDAPDELTASGAESKRDATHGSARRLREGGLTLFVLLLLLGVEVLWFAGLYLALRDPD
jgi:hypothetical protein